MLPPSAAPSSLEARRDRHLYSMKVCAALVVFFTLAALMLQWTLASGPQYVVAGTPRQFAMIEAGVAVAVAAYASLHLLMSSLAWTLIVLRLRHGSTAYPRYVGAVSGV